MVRPLSAAVIANHGPATDVRRLGLNSRAFYRCKRARAEMVEANRRAGVSETRHRQRHTRSAHVTARQACRAVATAFYSHAKLARLNGSPKVAPMELSRVMTTAREVRDARTERLQSG